MTPASQPQPPDDERLGAPVDATEAERPRAVSLAGRFGRIVRLDAARHGGALWDAVRTDERIWTYLPYGPYPDEDSFAAWLGERERLEDPFSYAILGADGRAVGVATLMQIRPAMRVIEVGHIVYGTPLQRTPLATEAQYLLAHYVFETLRYRRYEWKTNALNAPSRNAALRFGFTFEGIFRQHQIVKGRNRDTAWYSMLDCEWPARKAAFGRWLAPGNFGADGRQRTRLGENSVSSSPERRAAASPGDPAWAGNALRP